MESKANGGRKREAIQPYESKMTYECAGKPLDFSFMRIQTVACK